MALRYHGEAVGTEQRVCRRCDEQFEAVLFAAAGYATGRSRSRICPTCQDAARRQNFHLPDAEPDDEDQTPRAGGADRYVYVHEIRCLQCGRDVGTLRHPQERPAFVHLPEMRCSTCGGNGVLTGDATRKYVGPPITIEPTQRGRPPRLRAS